MMTPITEFRSRALVPSTPSSTAAVSEPRNAPVTTDPPNSSAPEAPANDSSLMPWTANGRSRAITTTLDDAAEQAEHGARDDRVAYEGQ